MKTAHVIFASRQIWPNLHSIMQLHAKKHLDKLFIYHTDNESESMYQARGLSSFAKEHLDIPVVSARGSIMPSEVTATMQKWISGNSGYKWVVNATGGLKLMTFGLFPLLADTNLVVVYREINGIWYRLTDNSEQGIVTEQIRVDESLTNTIPAADVLKIQNPALKNNRLITEPVKKLPLIKLTRLGIETGWDWKEMFNACGLGSNQIGGACYEQYIAAILIELGVQQIVLNATHKGRSRSLEELDILAHYNGRVFFLDCKLRTVEEEKAGSTPSLATQIKEAAGNRQEYGGANALGILLRPNRTLEEDQKTFAEAFKLKVIDLDGHRKVFENLSALLGMPMTKVLLECQKCLDDAPPGSVTTLAPMDHLPRGKGTRPEFLIKLNDTYMGERAAKSKEGFVVGAVIQNWHLVAIHPRTPEQQDAVDRICERGDACFPPVYISKHPASQYGRVVMMMLQLDEEHGHKTRKTLEHAKDAMTVLSALQGFIEIERNNLLMKYDDEAKSSPKKLTAPKTSNRQRRTI